MFANAKKSQSFTKKELTCFNSFSSREREKVSKQDANASLSSFSVLTMISFSVLPNGILS